MLVPYPESRIKSAKVPVFSRLGQARQPRGTLGREMI
jgi:hypothetical protein